MIRQHEVVAGACRYCQAVNPGPDSTCIWRQGDAVVTDAGRRTPAVECFDAISARIAELAAEGQEAMNKAPSLNLGPLEFAGASPRLDQRRTMP